MSNYWILYRKDDEDFIRAEFIADCADPDEAMLKFKISPKADEKTFIAALKDIDVEDE